MSEHLTDLAAEVRIFLTAIDERRNIRRGYMITRSTVAFARRLLARRASALNRLGVPHRQTV